MVTWSIPVFIHFSLSSCWEKFSSLKKKNITAVKSNGKRHYYNWTHDSRIQFIRNLFHTFAAHCIHSYAQVLYARYHSKWLNAIHFLFFFINFFRWSAYTNVGFNFLNSHFCLTIIKSKMINNNKWQFTVMFILLSLEKMKDNLKKVLSRVINFGRQCHFKIWLDCHKFKKIPCLIMPMSTKCQKKSEKKTRKNDN
jgi:hypothetical protein